MTNKTNKQHSLIFDEAFKCSYVPIEQPTELFWQGLYLEMSMGAVSGFNFIAYLGKNKEQSKTPIQM